MKKKKVTMSNADGSETAEVEVSVYEPIAEITTDFGRADLNEVVAKLNEVIKRLN